jgi:hypothetical protein
MLKFPSHPERWWQKRLVDDNGRPLPAELAVLRRVLRPGESGAWLNSRGTRTGVIDLARTPEGRLKTVRTELPEFVSDLLKSFYKMPNVTKGIFDLVIWNESDQPVRFVEVKCPHWDRLTPEQTAFTKIAQERNIEAEIPEWKFGI